MHYYEAHLNTFYCPIGVTPENRPEPVRSKTVSVCLFPNPSTGLLFADLSEWADQEMQVNVYDGQGSRVFASSVRADWSPQEFQMPAQLPAGLYYFEAISSTGERIGMKFELSR